MLTNTRGFNMTAAQHRAAAKAYSRLAKLNEDIATRMDLERTTKKKSVKRQTRKKS